MYDHLSIAVCTTSQCLTVVHEYSLFLTTLQCADAIQLALKNSTYHQVAS